MSFAALTRLEDIETVSAFFVITSRTFMEPPKNPKMFEPLPNVHARCR
jgi:hypothetical protein